MTPANAELRALLKSGRPLGRQRVRRAPKAERMFGDTVYDSKSEAEFAKLLRDGLIPAFVGNEAVREQVVFQLAENRRYTADFLVDMGGVLHVVEIKPGRRNKRTGQPLAYWMEGARVRFDWAKSLNPQCRFEVWVKYDGRFVKVEG